ncbi:hypothetical protein HPG69_000456 [Diceros bicornis minor]|uniref:Hsp90 co-chaperone Cdc37 n=1 Tax=Diceros bicornis minor TaxID=77932 RepID=A0A7J7EFZ5_DICBM|nr:hypothetical protein HPG69_000456 [Diceros bicornis minor]
MVDYSVWDHIEVSDDEDETHPNIDTASLFRWRHQVERVRPSPSPAAGTPLRSSAPRYRQGPAIDTRDPHPAVWTFIIARGSLIQLRDPRTAGTLGSCPRSGPRFRFLHGTPS